MEIPRDEDGGDRGGEKLPNAIHCHRQNDFFFGVHSDGQPCESLSCFVILCEDNRVHKPQLERREPKRIEPEVLLPIYQPGASPLGHNGSLLESRFSLAL